MRDREEEVEEDDEEECCLFDNRGCGLLVAKMPINAMR